MADSKATNPTLKTSELTLLSQFDELRIAWEEHQSARAKGGLLALSGFEHQFLLVLLKIVRRWKEATEPERHQQNIGQQVLSEAISDIAESGVVITLTQVKQTLSDSAISKALEEFWEIFNLASERLPALVKHLRFVVSGKFEGNRSFSSLIQGWGTRTKQDQLKKLNAFKEHVSHEVVTDPKNDLTIELQNLSRDEDTQTTIGRWLGYLLQLGSGISPEYVSTLVWRELTCDKGLEVFRATLGRLFSQSRYRLRAIRYVLGANLSLPRGDLLSQLQAAVFAQHITLLIGSSGSGKSALCKLAMQSNFQDFTCLFLRPSDIISFTETPNSTSSREIRRFDELIAAQIIEKPLIIIDDLDDVNDQKFDAVINFLQNVLAGETSTDVRFILVAHLDREGSIYDKIAARFGTGVSIDSVRLPQLPVDELQSLKDLPREVASLVRRANEFGPALNLKLLDWLTGSTQWHSINASSFRNDLDLLAWFWYYHVGNGHEVTNEGSILINISLSLAEQFTPDLPLHNFSVDTKILCTLVRRDCLRVAEGRVAVTHRFVGDCARFRYLLENRRQLEVSDLTIRLRNPLWSQPMRWFALYLAIGSERTEIWQELLQESLEGNHLQLIDLLLDGAILSRQPTSVLQGCLGDKLPFLIERILSRLFAIATFPDPYLAETFQSMSAGSRLAARESITGIPKAHLWEPVWRWLISQNQNAVIEESGLIFKAAEAWLNWGIFAEKFPLRVEVAEFTLDLAHKALLPDPDSEEGVVKGSDLIELAKQKHREPLPEKSTRKKRYYLGNFSTNAFACIVFALRIVPKRSVWLLRVLAGRKVIPATRLEPTQSHPLFGTGLLSPPNPKGPLGRVNRQFRKFMLSRGGLYLNAVIRIYPLLGAELLLALTIEAPHYRGYRYQLRYRNLENCGTAGSNDIDVCTFKFLPLLSLLEINEKLAIDVVETLCQIATHRNYEICENLSQSRNQSEGNPEADKLLSFIETDTHELTLIIDNTRKQFQGERQSLYWHRNYLAPKIVACLLMTIEGWLYSRPTRDKLEYSISLILSRSSTVAMLGVLVSLAKCDPSLLRKSLLPLISSLQLLVWLELEMIYGGESFGFDDIGAWDKLLKEEREEIFGFNQLSYRKDDLQRIIFNLWINEFIPSVVQYQILADWDNFQLALIPDINKHRASKIRAWFERSNWQEETDSQQNIIFRFVGTLPDDAKTNAETESALCNLQHLQIVVTCRRILDGETQKTLQLHDQFVNLLKSDEKLHSLKKQLGDKAFVDAIWAIVAIVSESPPDALEGELETELNYLADDLSNTSINLNRYSRCQYYDLDAGAFIAYVAPKLLRRLESESSLRASAFRCLIGVRDRSTSTFIRSWIKEYGLTHPLTRELVNLAPYIARLITLTRVLSYTNEIQQNMNPDGFYIIPRSEVIEQGISNQKNPQIEKAWSILQNEFVEGNISDKAIIDVSGWIPEILLQSFQEIPTWLQDNSFNWDFIAASFIPVLEAQPNCENAKNLVDYLREQVLFTLLHEREKVYNDYKADQEKDGYSSVNIQLYKAHSQLLDVIVINNYTDKTTSIDVIINALKSVGIVDCIILRQVSRIITLHNLQSLSDSVIESSLPNLIEESFKNYTAFTIGKYLLGLKTINQESDIRVLGNIRGVWEKLIELLSQEFQEDSNNTANLDTRLREFFKYFQDVLFSDWWLRSKLYQLAQSTKYKQLRREIFKTIIQHQKLMPNSRNDESEYLVKVLAELWDSDKTWIINRQSRLNGLKILLGQLQEIDAVGARRLADQVADFLAHPSN